MTARSRKEDRQRCLAAGMDGFLTKPVATATLLAAIDRVVKSRGQKSEVRDQKSEVRSKKSELSLSPVFEAGLLDPVAVLRACGDDPEGLRTVCQGFQRYAPARLAELKDALRIQDAQRLRQAAHKYSALLFAISTKAGCVVSELEDHAARGQLVEAPPLVDQLDVMTAELLGLIERLSLEYLRRESLVTRG